MVPGVGVKLGTGSDIDLQMGCSVSVIDALCSLRG